MSGTATEGSARAFWARWLGVDLLRPSPSGSPPVRIELSLDGKIASRYAQPPRIAEGRFHHLLTDASRVFSFPFGLDAT